MKPLAHKRLNAALVLLVVAQAIYYSVVTYGLREKTNEVYLACVQGTVRPVLSDGSFPYVKTDNGLHFKCASEGVKNV